MTVHYFDKNDGGLACFAIWEQGRSKEAEILDDLKSHFDVLATFQLHWSKEHYNRNLARLYEGAEPTKPFLKYSKKIGKPPFTFIIVRDPKPVFTYEKTVSGAIEAVNKNIIRCKRKYRSWFDKPYQVHSSCNAHEFALQSALILGVNVLNKTLEGCYKDEVVELKKDLEGAAGWENWNELFELLNYTSKYIFLRDFETFTKDETPQTLEVLCNAFQPFCSAANIQQDLSKPYCGVLKVLGQHININVRFVGDRYYPVSWAKDILSQRELRGCVYVPCIEDYFFSFLYHIIVHRSEIPDAEISTIRSLATQLGYDWLPVNDMDVCKNMCGVLSGYMQAKNYYYEQPIDGQVKVRKQVAGNLPQIDKIGLSYYQIRKQQWKSFIRAIKSRVLRA